MKNLMKNSLINVALTFTAFVSFTACTSVSNPTTTHVIDMHNAKNALDYEGVYRGTLPCADCEGIKTTVYINSNNTFKIVEDYLGKGVNTRESSGTYTWNKAGNSIILKTDQSADKRSYFVGENMLTQLDQSGNKITGNLAANYVFTKDNYALLNKKWKLIELFGKPLTIDASLRSEPGITFDDKENRYIAVTGCNNISGGFEILPYNKLKLSPGMSTMMACENMEIERKLGDVLQQADGFIINGDELTLIKGRMAPLAKFKTPMN